MPSTFRNATTAIVGAAALLVVSSAQALPVQVYAQDFESNLAGFSGGILGNAPASDGTLLTMYNGQLGNNSTTLTVDLSGFAHTQVSLQFDLYLFGSWDGEDTDFGTKDFFTLSGDVSFSETFTNHQPEGQSYNGTPDETFGVGSERTDVYRDLGPTGADIEFLFSHTSDLLTVVFSGGTLENESWAIDNVRVSVDDGMAAVPLAATLPFAASALGIFAALGRMRRRSKFA